MSLVYLKNNSANIKSMDDLDNEYVGKKVAVILTTPLDTWPMMGYAYAISEDHSSYKELCKLKWDLKEEGKESIIVGSYQTGGVLSAQR